jgi:hypothetical protein
LKQEKEFEKAIDKSNYSLEILKHPDTSLIE